MPIALILSAVGWLLASMVFEGGYQMLHAKTTATLQKHQWCWLWWSALGVLSFATGGASALIQTAMVFCIAAGHIGLSGVKEGVISPMEIVKNIPHALRGVYEKFRRI